MPPKPKFTREEIVNAALALVSERGADALTARELGVRLGSSARPIFTVFRGMDELQEDVRRAALQRFESFPVEPEQEMPYFKQVGMRMLLFGLREPKLYQLLFMREVQPEDAGFDGLFGRLGPMAGRCIDALEQEYGLARDEARRLFRNVWLYTFGLGALCATGAGHFTHEELSRLLSDQFRASMLLLRTENPA